MLHVGQSGLAQSNRHTAVLSSSALRISNVTSWPIGVWHSQSSVSGAEGT